MIWLYMFSACGNWLIWAKENAANELKVPESSRLD